MDGPLRKWRSNGCSRLFFPTRSIDGALLHFFFTLDRSKKFATWTTILFSSHDFFRRTAEKTALVEHVRCLSVARSVGYSTWHTRCDRSQTSGERLAWEFISAIQILKRSHEPHTTTDTMGKQEERKSSQKAERRWKENHHLFFLNNFRVFPSRAESSNNDNNRPEKNSVNLPCSSQIASFSLKLASGRKEDLFFPRRQKKSVETLQYFFFTSNVPPQSGLLCFTLLDGPDGENPFRVYFRCAYSRPKKKFFPLSLLSMMSAKLTAIILPNEGRKILIRSCLLAAPVYRILEWNLGRPPLSPGSKNVRWCRLTLIAVEGATSSPHQSKKKEAAVSFTGSREQYRSFFDWLSLSIAGRPMVSRSDGRKAAGRHLSSLESVPFWAHSLATEWGRRASLSFRRLKTVALDHRGSGQGINLGSVQDKIPFGKRFLDLTRGEGAINPQTQPREEEISSAYFLLLLREKGKPNLFLLLDFCNTFPASAPQFESVHF